MQVGHIILSFLISTYDWNLTTILLVLFFSHLPNLDVFLIWFKLVPKEYHCSNSFTHTLLFALIVTGITAIFSLKYALFAFISLILHYLVDLPTNTGVPLLYPFSKKKFTLNLWKETGFWGKKSFFGYYSQKWAWILEGILMILLIIRLIIIL